MSRFLACASSPSLHHPGPPSLRLGLPWPLARTRSSCCGLLDLPCRCLPSSSLQPPVSAVSSRTSSLRPRRLMPPFVSPFYLPRPNHALLLLPCCSLSLSKSPCLPSLQVWLSTAMAPLPLLFTRVGPDLDLSAARSKPPLSQASTAAPPHRSPPVLATSASLRPCCRHCFSSCRAERKSTSIARLGQHHSQGLDPAPSQPLDRTGPGSWVWPHPQRPTFFSCCWASPFRPVSCFFHSTFFLIFPERAVLQKTL